MKRQSQFSLMFNARFCEVFVFAMCYRCHMLTTNECTISKKNRSAPWSAERHFPIWHPALYKLSHCTICISLYPKEKHADLRIPYTTHRTFQQRKTNIHSCYINNCPTRCNTKQSIYYSPGSLYMFRVSNTPIIRSTQNCNYSLRYWS